MIVHWMIIVFVTFFYTNTNRWICYLCWNTQSLGNIHCSYVIWCLQIGTLKYLTVKKQAKYPPWHSDSDLTCNMLYLFYPAETLLTSLLTNWHKPVIMRRRRKKTWKPSSGVPWDCVDQCQSWWLYQLSTDGMTLRGAMVCRYKGFL